MRNILVLLPSLFLLASFFLLASCQNPPRQPDLDRATELRFQEARSTVLLSGAIDESRAQVTEEVSRLKDLLPALGADVQRHAATFSATVQALEARAEALGKALSDAHLAFEAKPNLETKEAFDRARRDFQSFRQRLEEADTNFGEWTLSTRRFLASLTAATSESKAELEEEK